MLDQLLSQLDSLEQQRKAHMAEIGARMLLVGQVESQKALLRRMIEEEQQRQEQERQKAQNEPSPSV